MYTGTDRLAELMPVFKSLQIKNLLKMVPLNLHGDGTPSQGVGKSWGRMTDFYSWSSVLAWTSRSELLRYMIIAMQARNNLRILETKSLGILENKSIFYDIKHQCKILEPSGSHED